MNSTPLSSFGLAPVTVELHPFASGPSPVSALRVACSVLPDGVRFAFVLEGRIDALRVPVRDDGPDAWPLWRHTCFEAFLSVPGEESYREVNFSPTGLWAAMAFRGYRDIEREITGDGTPPIIETEVKHSSSSRRGGCLIPTSPLVGEGLGESVWLSAPSPSGGRLGWGPTECQKFTTLAQLHAPLAPTLTLPQRGREDSGYVHTVTPTRGEVLDNPALHLTAQLPRALLPGGPLLQIGLSAVIERTDGQLEYWALCHPLADRADFHHRDGWTLRLDTRQETQP